MDPGIRATEGKWRNLLSRRSHSSMPDGIATLPCHPEETTCLRQVKGAMNSAGHRALDGCPMFAPAYVGRKSRAKPLELGSGYGCSLGAKPRDLQAVSGCYPHIAPRSRFAIDSIRCTKRGQGGKCSSKMSGRGMLESESGEHIGKLQEDRDHPDAFKPLPRHRAA